VLPDNLTPYLHIVAVFLSFQVSFSEQIFGCCYWKRNPSMEHQWRKGIDNKTNPIFRWLQHCGIQILKLWMQVLTVMVLWLLCYQIRLKNPQRLQYGNDRWEQAQTQISWSHIHLWIELELFPLSFVDYSCRLNY
jgi:hypothetical protein